MVSPLKMPSTQPAILRQAEDLGQRPRRRVAFQALHRARAERDHAVLGFAAQRLLPRPGRDIELVPRQRHGEGGRGRVAEREARAVAGDPLGVGDAHARCRAVPGEDDVAPGRGLRQIGQAAVRRLEQADVAQLELGCDVVGPGLAEALPGEHIDAARAQQGPQRQLHRAGVGGRHDADAVVGRNAEHGARSDDHLGELRLAGLRAVRAPKRCVRRVPATTSPAAWRRGRRRSSRCAAEDLVLLIISAQMAELGGL